MKMKAALNHLKFKNQLTKFCKAELWQSEGVSEILRDRNQWNGVLFL